MKISHKVPLIATCVILAAFAAFGTFQYKMIEKNLYTDTESHVSEVSKLLKSDVTQWLNLRLQTVSGMAEYIADSTDEKTIVYVTSNTAFAPNADYYYTVLEQSDGHMITSYTPQLPDGWDGRTRPWYKQAMQSDETTFTAPYIDSGDGQLLITAIRKLNKNNGVLAADFNLKAISDSLKVDFNKTGYAFLVNGEGTIITHPQKSAYGKNIGELYASKPDLTTKLQEKTIANNPVLTTFYPLDNFKGSIHPWYIGVVLDKTKVFAPAKELIKTTAITAIITAIIASILFYLFMLGTLIKPVRTLAQESDKISHGQLDTTISGVDRNDEIGELAQAVQRMEKALGMAMKRLKKLS